MTKIGVLSYNVRYANRGDHHDAWHDRRDAVARLVRFHQPDIAAFQEPVPEQRRDLRERLPSYEFVGRGRNPGGDGEGCPIAVDADRWEVVDDGTFWLSETPEEPSTDWNAAHPRIATWVHVRGVSTSGETATNEPGSDLASDAATATAAPAFLLINTHFDHVSAQARRESARLLRDRLTALARSVSTATAGVQSGANGREDEGKAGDIDSMLPVVFVGDLNCTPGSVPHRVLLGDDPETADAADRDRADAGTTTAGTSDPDATGDPQPIDLRDAAAAADLRHGPETSLTDFARLIDGRRIDHALVSPAFEVEAFATLADRDDRGRYPSDHLPILSRLEL